MMDERTQHNGNQETPESPCDSRGQGLSEPILLDPHRLNDDMRLAQRAAKERWPIPQDKRQGLVERLYDITAKRSVLVPMKGGELVEVDGPADANAIAAARVLVSMDALNQDAAKPAGRGGINVDVNVTTGVQLYLPDNGRSASNRVVDSQCDVLPGSSDVPAIDYSED